MKLVKTDFEKAEKKYDELISRYYWKYDYKDWKDNPVENNIESHENWNLRDLVAGMDYCLSKFYEEGNVNFVDRGFDYDEWATATTKMKRFIKRWLPKCENMKPYKEHNSHYDDPSVNCFVNYHVYNVK